MKSHNADTFNSFQKKFPVLSMAMGIYGRPQIAASSSGVIKKPTMYSFSLSCLCYIAKILHALIQANILITSNLN
ncbi:hypothetical protein, partial [Legionella sp.]|uniref:hypothetical protein n=1 Tax=Legionella sp. TaxID=459 RepID=UPI003D09A973